MPGVEQDALFKCHDELAAPSIKMLVNLQTDHKCLTLENQFPAPSASSGKLSLKQFSNLTCSSGKPQLDTAYPLPVAFSMIDWLID